MPYLLALGGDQNGRFFDLEAGVTIGTDRSCDIHLRDTRVSWRHARAEADGENAAVEDLGSSDGTFVNGRPVERAELHEGDIVETGGIRFAFVAAMDSVAGAPRQDVLRPASQEINQLREESHQLREESDQLREEGDRIREEGTQLREEGTQLREKSEELEKLLEERAHEIANLRAQVEVLKEAADERARRVGDAQRSDREALERLDEKLKQSHSQRDAAASRCLELEKTLEHLEASLGDTKGEYEATASRRREVEKKVKRVEATLKQAQNDRDAATARLKERDERIEALDASLGRTRTELEQSSQRSQELEAQLETQVAALADAKRERDSALSHGAAGDRATAELRGQLTVAEERCLTSAKELDNVRRELALNVQKAVEDREALHAEHGRALDELRASVLPDAKRARDETASQVQAVEQKAEANLDSYRKRRDEEEVRRRELADRERHALKAELDRAKTQCADQLAQTEAARIEMERLRSEREELLAREQDRRHQELLKAEEIFRGRERDWQRLYAKDAEHARAERDRLQENIKDLLGELRQAQLQQQSRERANEAEETLLRTKLRDAEAASVAARAEHEKRVREIQEVFDQRFTEYEQAREAAHSAWAAERQELVEKLEAAGGLQQSTAWELDETRSLLEEVRRRAGEEAAASERRANEHRAAMTDLEANHRTELADFGEQLRSEFSERERALARDRSDAEAAMATELRQLRDYVDDLKARIRLKEEELREKNQDFVERVATCASGLLRRQGVVQVPVPTAASVRDGSVLAEGNGADEGRKGV